MSCKIVPETVWGADLSLNSPIGEGPLGSSRQELEGKKQGLTSDPEDR